MTSPDLAAIVRDLTPAQKVAISSCFQNAERHAPYHMFPNTAANRLALRSLLPVGFITSEDGGFDLVVTRGRPLAMVSFTSLGEQVHAHLVGGAAKKP